MSEQKEFTKILGMLDSDTRLCCDHYNAFIIQVKATSEDGSIFWISKYFYATISSAIKGYANYYMSKTRKKKLRDEPLLDVINLIDQTEKVIKSIGDRLSAEFSILYPNCKTCPYRFNQSKKI